MHRRHGLPVERAWRAGLTVALGDCRLQDRQGWLEALGWWRPAWEASYVRQPWPEPFAAVDLGVLEAEDLAA